jgi:hypothetical protein
MISHESEMDPLQNMLAKFPGQATDELRASIQEKTLAVLRRRRWTRRVVWVSGLAACYAAGILTMALINHSHEGPNVATAPNIGAAPEGGSSPPPTQPPSPKAMPKPETALAMEWQALDSEERRPELFRLAGDKYLLANDIQSATRCYRSALQGASDEELHITINDNWLFMSLKEAKLEENRYAKLDRP